MIRGLIICPDQPVSASLQASLNPIRDLEVSRAFHEYPEQAELSRVLRVHAPEAVFVSFEDPVAARRTVERIEKQAKGVQIVGVHKKFDPAILKETMRCGVREFLAHPFNGDAVVESLCHVRDLLLRNPVQYETTNEVFSFVPAKAGSGASTLALNVAVALAARTRVLLSDFDLNSGVIR